jgi:hypothetical protein
MNPAMFHPYRMRTWRPNPFALMPHISFTDPLVIAVGPDITGSRCNSDSTDVYRGGRANSNNHFRGACGAYE